MKNIELFVHTESGAAPKLITTSDDTTVKQLLQAIYGANAATHLDDLHVFIEGIEGALDHHRTLCECEVRHRHHIHCGRCREVKVSVFYNGEREESFPPSATGEKILKWAVKAFKLTPAEAADKILLFSGTEQELPLDAHIGSYTKPGHCSVNLALTAPVEVQG